MNVLAPLPVLLPLIGAALALLLGHHPRIQRSLSIVTLTAVLGVSVALLVEADSNGAFAVGVGGWGPDIGITLVVDRLSALMLIVSSVVTLSVLFYAVGQGTTDGDEETPLSIFHPTYLVLAAGVSNAFLSGDLFNLYVGFEMLLVASYVLLTIGGTGPRVQAGITYIVVSLVSSIVFLSGIAYVYAATGTLNLAQLADRIPQLPEGTQLMLELVLLVAFGIKAAIFPLSAWLPDSYPTAPAPVTAVFAGLLTKVGVYAIIRLETLMFPNSDTNWLLLIAAFATMVVGILGAVAQSDIKRLLSFTLVSHIGYMIFGIGLGTAAGLAGAIFYVAHHILIQTTLFLVTGLIERVGGTTSIRHLAGLASASPLLAVLFFIPAMNLAGIPPFSGFVGKVGLLEAGAMDGSVLAWILVGGGVVTSLLTLYAVAKVWNKAFWRDDSEVLTADVTPAAGDIAVAAPARSALPLSMTAPTVMLVVIGIGLTVVAGPLYEVTARAADDLLLSSPYIDAVRGGATE